MKIQTSDRWLVASLEREAGNNNEYDNRDNVRDAANALLDRMAHLRAVITMVTTRRVVRSTCADSLNGEFRVHLSEREWDQLLSAAKEALKNS